MNLPFKNSKRLILIGKRVEELCRSELEEVGEQLLKEPDSRETKHQLDRLAGYQKFLNMLPTRAAPERAAAIVIVSASLLAAAVLWFVPRTPISFHLETNSTEVALYPSTYSVNLGGLIREARGVKLHNFSSIHGPGVVGDSGESATGAASYEVSNCRVSLDTFMVENTSIVIIRLRGERRVIELEVRGGDVSGALLIDDCPGLLPAGELDTVRFYRRNGGDVPVRLSFQDARWSQPLRGIGLQRIDFLRGVESISANKRFESSLERGLLTIRDTGSEYEIQHGDNLTLSGLLTYQFELTLEETLAVSIEGQASGVMAGPLGWERQLRPSLLEYLAQDRHWALIWSGFLFISGVLWNLRRSLGI